jgi:hypothetical protein
MSDLSAPIAVPPAAGEVRIVGSPASRPAARRTRPPGGRGRAGVPVTGFSLADLEQVAARESITLRALLEELRAAGLELVAEAPVDLLQDPRRSIEEVNIAGLALARLTVDRADSADALPLLKQVAELQRAVGVVRAFAPLARRVNPRCPPPASTTSSASRWPESWSTTWPSIQVDWSLYGPKLAQVALTVGADDVDAVSAEDDTRRVAAARRSKKFAATSSPPAQEPVERNGRFEILGAMTRVRLGAVGYLNARPLVYELERLPRFDVRYDTRLNARACCTRAPPTSA